MAIYVKPSGVEVEVNDNSADVAKSLGWVKKKGRPSFKPRLTKPKDD